MAQARRPTLEPWPRYSGRWAESRGLDLRDAAQMNGVVNGDPLATTVVDVATIPAPEDPEPPNRFSSTDFRNAPYLEPFSEEDIPAQLSVTLADSTRVIPDFNSFFLTSAQEQDVEKLQITDTKGSFWAHFFGRKPRVWSFTGNLVSARNHDWHTLWDAIYERYFRGTRCAELGAKVQLTYANKSIYGWMISSSKALTSDNEFGVGLAFQILVDEVLLMHQDDVLKARYGVKGIDGLPAAGDLGSLAEVAAKVAALDSAAGEVVDSILKGDAATSTPVVEK